jgi:hypothetical protein
MWRSIENKEYREFQLLWVAKMPSTCIFIAFELAQIGRPNGLSTVKTSVLLFNFKAGRNFVEEQGLPESNGYPVIEVTFSALC